MSDRLLDTSALGLAAMIRRREVSPVSVVRRHIERIEAVNPALNAVVATRFDEALDEARRAEAALADADGLPPLHGVPCTVKEFFAVRGLPQTGGLLARKEHRSAEDSIVVARLRRAGAIVLGVTNAPEGGISAETHNLVYGRTNNPWSLGRTPGGSSGGEGAIVAAGGAAFGMGSDIGGSIRIPSAFCGVFGHKPTGRLVPTTGHFPNSLGEHRAYMGSGPMCRSARDLMPLLRVIAGPDGVDDVARHFDLGDPDAVDLRQLRIFPVPHNGRTWVSRDQQRAVGQAARALEARGATRSALPRLELDRAFEIWSAMMARDPDDTYVKLLGDGRPIPLWWEVVKLPFGRSRHTLPALAVALLEELVRVMDRGRHRMDRRAHALRDQLEAALGPRGVMIYPPYTRAAPPHNGQLLTPLHFAYTCLFNVLELPATVAPVGFDRRGLPLSVQIVGARGQDHLTIAVAQALEEAFGGWRRAEPPAARGPLGRLFGGWRGRQA